jgi:hypothetical protein
MSAEGGSSERPSLSALWRLALSEQVAGGHDANWRGQRYRELAIQHGHLRARTGDGECSALPCGYRLRAAPVDADS